MSGTGVAGSEGGNATLRETVIGWVRTPVKLGYNMAVTESGQPVLRCDVLPDLPALPAVAIWLEAHPDAIDQLWHVLDIYGNSAHADMYAEAALDSLVAALRQPADGGEEA